MRRHRWKHILVLVFAIISIQMIASPVERINCDAYMTVQTYKNAPVNIYPQDAFGTAIPFSITKGRVLRQPSNGTISLDDIVDGIIEYTPRIGFVGEDSLACQVSSKFGTNKHVWIKVIVAAAPTTEGTEFWVSFMENLFEGLEGPLVHGVFLTIATREATEVRVHNVCAPYDTLLYVPADTAISFQVPYDYSYADRAEEINFKALHIVSTNSIALYAENYSEETFDATNVLPTQSLGSEYLIQNYTGLQGSGRAGPYMYPPQFNIIATENNTIVDVSASTTTIKGTLNPTRTYVMNRGECLLIQSASKNTLTGSYVNAHGKKIAVYTGDMCTVIPDGATACDNLVEQAVPNHALGKKFVITSTIARRRDYVEVTALYDNTEVRLDNVTHKVLNAYETDTIVIPFTDPVHLLETSKACVCYQYLSSQNIPGLGEASGGLGDPAMVLINPLDQMVYECVFATFRYSLPLMQYVNIVTPTATVDSLTLDNVTVSWRFDFVPSAPEWSYARIPISHGMHKIKNEAGGFIAYVYGLESYESYAYNVASQFQVLDTTIIIQDTICEGASYNFLGKTYTEDSVYIIRQDWSDTIYQLELTIDSEHRYEVTEYDTICSHDTYSWHGHVYSESGLFTDTLTSQYGCDSITHLKLVTLSILSNHLYDTICEGEIYTWNDKNYYESVLDSVTKKSIAGCDSTCYLHLYVIPRTYSNFTYSLCQGDNVMWRGENYTQAGLFSDTISSTLGCDSIISLLITPKVCDTTDIPLNPMPFIPIRDTIDTTICVGETYTLNGIAYSVEGQYLDTGYYWFGWDSVYWTLNLKLKPCECDTAYSTTYKQVKEEELPLFQWNGISVPQVPQAETRDTTLVFPTIKADASCDSIATLHLHILAPCEFPTKEYPKYWRKED